MVGCLWLQLLQTLVGVAGFGLHFAANLANHPAPLSDRMLYGVPIFAPLLFADLATLAAIGIGRQIGLLRDRKIST